MNSYQKILCCVLLSAILLLCGCENINQAVLGGEGAQNTASALAGRVLRLHILANSDGSEDQRVKLLVRDAVNAYERTKMHDAKNKDEAKAELMADGAGLQAVVEEVLEDNGCSYGATLYAGKYAFPERKYGEMTFPAGEYEALRIVLGEGQGQNWWCVMFPPLCILEGKEGKIEYGQFKFDSLLKKMLKRSEEKHGSGNQKDSTASGAGDTDGVAAASG